MSAAKIRQVHCDFMVKYGYAFEPNAVVMSHEDYRALCRDLVGMALYPVGLGERRHQFMGMTIYRSDDAAEPRAMLDALAQDVPPKEREQ